MSQSTLKSNNENIFLDLKKILSYNAYMNFIIGERGVGKSYGIKKYLVKHFQKTGKKFIYVRRYSREIVKAIKKGNNNYTFFDQIKSDKEMKGLDLSNNNEEAFVNKKVAGYFITLSTSVIEKSATFEDVDTIVFDEAFITKGTYHYLRGEVQTFLDLVESVGRLRDVKIFLIANATSQNNPYFTEFNLSLPYNSEFKTFKNGLICVWYVKNLKYREVKKKTKFGQLVSGTKYGAYAMENEFLEDSKTFIKKKSKKSKYTFTLHCVGYTFGVYFDSELGEMFITPDVNPEYPLKLTLNFDAHNENNLLIRTKSNIFLQILTQSYYKSKLFFENSKIKAIVMPDFLRYLQ